MTAFVNSIDKFKRFLRRCNKINGSLQLAARKLAKEANNSVNMSYQLNSYAFYSKGLIATITNSLQPGDKTKVEKLFSDFNPKTKDEGIREALKLQNDIRKRVLLSSHFGTAFKSKKMEAMLFDMKEVLKNYPSLVKAREARNDRSQTPLLEGQTLTS